MGKQALLEPGLDLTEVHRRIARLLPDYAHCSTGVVTVLQAQFMSLVDVVNNRSAGLPDEMLRADIEQVHESAAELEAMIGGVTSLGLAVASIASRYTRHARLLTQYGRQSPFEGVDVLDLAAESLTHVTVLPRPGLDGTFDPLIYLRVRSSSDPQLSLLGQDGRFCDAASPGAWYKFPLDAVLVAGVGSRAPGQQI